MLCLCKFNEYARLLYIASHLQMDLLSIVWVGGGKGEEEVREKEGGRLAWQIIAHAGIFFGKRFNVFGCVMESESQ